MIKSLNLLSIGTALLFLPCICFSQYIMNGSTTQDSCNCYTLTTPTQYQTGSVWQGTKINLNDSFDYSLKVFLGCNDTTGADGVAFVLQPLSTNIGTNGEGWGFEGIVPSVGISLDTYANPDDPLYDNIAIRANGDINDSNALAGPVPASSTSNNIKDCNWHVLRIRWDPSTHTLSTWFDGVSRLTLQKDIVADIFGNDPMVYWGFSASTGNYANLQKFCTPLIPAAITGLVDSTGCVGTPVIFKDNSESYTTIQNFFWDFGDGTTSTLQNPPPHYYPAPGNYTVTHTILAQDNCTSPSLSKVITVLNSPTLSLKVSDTCLDLSPRIEMTSSIVDGQIDGWQWQLDGSDFSNERHPDFSQLSTGNHTIALVQTDNIKCNTNAASSSFKINSLPDITFQANDGCTNVPITFAGQQTDYSTTITKWLWYFGDGNSSLQQNSQHIFTIGGDYKVALSAESNYGCVAEFSDSILVNAAHADAGKDTVALANTQFQLNGSGGTQYNWWPATGLNDPNSQNPIGQINSDMSYLLTVTTPEGCTDTASVNVILIKNTDIFVPTAFTPNNDGLNDVIAPYLVGIKTLYYFTIYNRWGQKVFSTDQMNKGWDGKFNGRIIENSSYVWLLKALDVTGRVYNLKGTFVLIK
ncbi:MAG TPA: PKD domain-containing protein [Hanamia sp.]